MKQSYCFADINREFTECFLYNSIRLSRSELETVSKSHTHPKIKKVGHVTVGFYIHPGLKMLAESI